MAHGQISEKQMQALRKAAGGIKTSGYSFKSLSLLKEKFEKQKPKKKKGKK